MGLSEVKSHTAAHVQLLTNWLVSHPSRNRWARLRKRALETGHSLLPQMTFFPTINPKHYKVFKVVVSCSVSKKTWCVRLVPTTTALPKLCHAPSLSSTSLFNLDHLSHQQSWSRLLMRCWIQFFCPAGSEPGPYENTFAATGHFHSSWRIKVYRCLSGVPLFHIFVSLSSYVAAVLATLYMLADNHSQHLPA